MALKLARVLLSGAMRWNVAVDDPLITPLSSFGNLELINPLACPDNGFAPSVFALSAKQWHLIVRELCFQYEPEVHDVENHSELISGLLRTLRLTSKQAALPTELMMIQYADVDFTPKMEFPKPIKGDLMGSYRVETAVTQSCLEESNRLGVNPDIDICHEIFLDSLRALQEGDHRQAILYGAIAVESLARTVLEKNYKKALTAPVMPAHLNVLEFVQPGNEKIKKDPIYVLLIEGESFSRLLHEVPLYLLRKSLLNENQDLYRQALKLYKTRNRIGHGEIVRERDSECFTIDREGAFRGLGVALAVFQWFGVIGYRLPLFDSVRIGDW